jgi:hypothetical protein
MQRTIFGPTPAGTGAPTYDAGHLIADSLGGPNEVGNLVPILRSINRYTGAWRRMENWLTNCLGQRGMQGVMEVVPIYNESAPGVNKYIPTSFAIQVLLSTSPTQSQIHPFTIQNLAGAPFSAPPRCI